VPNSHWQNLLSNVPLTRRELLAHSGTGFGQNLGPSIQKTCCCGARTAGVWILSLARLPFLRFGDVLSANRLILYRYRSIGTRAEQGKTTS